MVTCTGHSRMASRSSSRSPRLSADPRVVVRHRALNLLAEVQLVAPDRFVLDWTRVGPNGEAAGQYMQAGSPYEGYVDALRSGGAEACFGFVRDVELPEPKEVLYEFAPYGPSALRVDGESVVEVGGDLGAILGQGVLVPLSLDAGSHRFEVWTCRDRESGRYAGFYWLERPRGAQS